MSEAILTPEGASQIKKAGLWLIVLGILQVIAGFFALTAPLFAGIAVAYLVGIAIFMGGWGKIIIGTTARSAAG